MNRKTNLALTAAAVLIGASLLFVDLARAAEDTPPGRVLPAESGDFSLRVEPGLAFPLTDPQNQLYKMGGGLTLKGLWNLNRYLDVGPSVTFLGLPSQSTVGQVGTEWALGAGLRLKRPHDSQRGGFYATSPWLDADLLYVRTGELDRFGFSIGAGLSVPVDEARIFWLGPFLRYHHIVQQPERAGFDNHDAKILSLGLSLEVGSGVERERPAVVVVATEPEIRTVNTKTYFCPDRDKDTVPDAVDRCPDFSGPMDNWGCPYYKKLVVKRDKLELNEKLYFDWDKATLQEVSFEVLDDVVQALKDNKGFQVQVGGHASSDGGDEHNQTLSEQRAAAVLDYLASHGIGKERLVSKGFGSTVPADTNKTEAGRENNRRVEFVVHFLILNDGSK